MKSLAKKWNPPKRALLFLGCSSLLAVCTPFSEASPIKAIVSGVGNPSSVAADPVRPYIYVANETDSIPVISTQSNTVAYSLTVSDLPNIFGNPSAYSIAVDPNDQYLYVGVYGLAASGPPLAAGGFEAISFSTGATILSFPLAAPPNYVAVSPNGNYIYIAAFNGWITMLSGGIGGFETGINVGGNPLSVAFTPDSSTALVSGAGSGILVINTATGSVSGSIPLPNNDSASGVAISADGQTAYIDGRNGIYVASIPDEVVTATISLRSHHFKFGGGTPALNPGGDYLYMFEAAGNKVLIIDTQSLQEYSAFNTNGGAGQMAITPNGKFGWVPYESGQVAAVKLLR
jgi:DNA-binding beta-propeller fold protein YncE